MLRQGLFHRRPEFAQRLGLTQQIAAPAAELGERRLVSALRRLQLTPETLHVVDETAKLVVQSARAPGDLLGVAVLLLVTPDVVNDAQGHHQRGRADDDDTPLEGFGEHPLILLHGHGERRLDGHEQQHEIQRAHVPQLIVILLRQALDVGAQADHMLAHGGIPQRGIIFRQGLFVGQQGQLGIHHHVLVVGQTDQHIGALQAALVVAARRLGEVLVAFPQPRGLEHPLEHHLAPIALRLGVALERLGEVLGFAVDALAGLLQIAHLHQQRRAILALGTVDGVDAFAEIRQLLTQRREHVRKLGLMALALPLEDLVGEQLELALQRLAALPEQRLLLDEALVRLFEPGLQPGFGGLPLGQRIRALQQLCLQLHQLPFELIQAALGSQQFLRALGETLFQLVALAEVTFGGT